ncbi:hypothetical protein FHU33_3328 [Blastococcus colisei]|uniref:Uncharacterized protein n=2 Tax=Blastococcus colisei TaxID=1564162 RepID=A0A543PIF6_9ACTN|nr:hypothetical protein FHU33_3328 [Blastococcus colisei]
MVSGWLGLDWGNVPTWIGTIVTSSFFTVAALSYRRSVLDRERAQASTVAAWIARRSGEDRTQHRATGTTDRVLLVHNGSDSPVSEVNVRVPGTALPYRLDQVPAKATSERELPRERAGMLIKFATGNVATGYEVSGGPLPEVEFRDAAGRLWKRDKDGRLIPLRLADVEVHPRLRHPVQARRRRSRTGGCSRVS